MAKVLIAGDFFPNNEELTSNFLEHYLIINNYIYSIINLEGPFTDSWKQITKVGPHLRIDPAWANKLKNMAFQGVSLANNHILDMGEIGIHETIEHCNRAGLCYLGAGRNLQEARKPLIIEENGIKIGFLAFTENEFSVATESAAGASPVDPIDNYHDISELRKCVDKVIVLYHGGNEHYPFPRPGMQKICRFYVDAGANAVICHHSHTTSGYEIYKEAPIFYGIGNFYFPRNTDEISDWNYGYLVSLELTKGNPLSFEILPYYFNENSVNLLSGNEKEQFLSEINRKNLIINDPIRLSQEWSKFIKQKQSHYIYNILAYSRADRFLFRLNILRPKFFLKKLLLTLNYIRCESHRELLMNSLSQMIDASANKNSEK